MPRNTSEAFSYAPGGTISPYRIVKYGAADGQVVQAAGSTDLLCGIANELGAASTDNTVDVWKDDIGEVELGGTVTRGNPLTSDANGKAVAAAPAAGVNATIIGYAEKSGVAGDIIPVWIVPTRIQG